jgi:hypothetical protein
VVFAWAKAYDRSATAGQGKVLLTPAECREFTREGKPFRFDLYRFPFNEDRGGPAEPITGAAEDGRSNFFPKYSPDGRWIVFSSEALSPSTQSFLTHSSSDGESAVPVLLDRSFHSTTPSPPRAAP